MSCLAFNSCCLAFFVRNTIVWHLRGWFCKRDRERERLTFARRFSSIVAEIHTLQLRLKSIYTEQQQHLDKFVRSTSPPPPLMNYLFLTLTSVSLLLFLFVWSPPFSFLLSQYFPISSEKRGEFQKGGSCILHLLYSRSNSIPIVVVFLNLWDFHLLLFLSTPFLFLV